MKRVTSRRQKKTIKTESRGSRGAHHSKSDETGSEGHALERQLEVSRGQKVDCAESKAHAPRKKHGHDCADNATEEAARGII